MRKLNVVLTAAAAVTLSAAPLSAQWGIFGRNSSGVPAGHMPSRGMCRVWIDGVPPGRQPRQTDCRTAERQRPYYEQRFGRRARVLYGERSNRNDRYDTRDRGVIVLGRRNGDGTVYGDRTGTNCRYVERVIAGRVIRQRVCDQNGVYDRNGQIYDRNGQVYDRNGRVYDRNGRVYDRNGNVIYRRNRRDDRWGRSDRDSDDSRGSRGKYKNRGGRGDD
jgi:hypothetical protein